MFIPEFDAGGSYWDCSTTKWGCWTATELVAHQSFINAGSYNTTATRYDYAFGVVGAGGKGNTQLDATVGSFPIAFSGVSANAQMYAFGYPAGAPYNGTDLIYCAGKIAADFFNANQTWGMVCNMTGGASGGPWFSGFNEATGSGTLGVTELVPLLVQQPDVRSEVHERDPGRLHRGEHDDRSRDGDQPPAVARGAPAGASRSDRAGSIWARWSAGRARRPGGRSPSVAAGWTYRRSSGRRSPAALGPELLRRSSVQRADQRSEDGWIGPAHSRSFEGRPAGWTCPPGGPQAGPSAEPACPWSMTPAGSR